MLPKIKVVSKQSLPPQCPGRTRNNLHLTIGPVEWNPLSSFKPGPDERFYVSVQVSTHAILSNRYEILYNHLPSKYRGRHRNSENRFIYSNKKCISIDINLVSLSGGATNLTG